MRRIVTGHDQAGTSTIVNDGRPPRLTEFTTLRGFVSGLMWSTEPGAPISATGADTTPGTASLVPAEGGTRLITLTFPPESVRAEPDFDGQAMGVEFASAMPGLAELFAPDGTHTTPTIDYVIVTAGEIWLEMDNGTRTQIKQGDVVVQNGTRHAWRNLSDEPATLVVVFVGAQSVGPSEAS